MQYFHANKTKKGNPEIELMNSPSSMDLFKESTTKKETSHFKITNNNKLILKIILWWKENKENSIKS